MTMSSSKNLTIAEVNSLNFVDFIRAFCNVIDSCPLVAVAIWSCKPFGNLEELQSAISNFIDQLPLCGQEGLLRLIPKISGKVAAREEHLSTESIRERKTFGLDMFTNDEQSMLSELNSRYISKFGFNFVICARQNKSRKTFLSALESRMKNTTKEEIQIGLNELKQICKLRLRDIVDE